MTQKSNLKKLSLLIRGELVKVIYSKHLRQNSSEIDKLTEAQPHILGNMLLGQRLLRAQSFALPVSEGDDEGDAIASDRPSDGTGRIRVRASQTTEPALTVGQSREKFLSSAEDEEKEIDNLRRQQLLVEITQLIRRSSSIKIVFDTVTRSLCELFNCDRLSIVRLTSRNIALESQFSTDQLGNRLPQITEADFNFDLETKLVAKSNYFQLSVPILLEQVLEPISYYPLWGWLIAEHSSSRQWDISERIFLQQLSIQLSIALNQKLLYQTLQNADRQLHASRISNQHFQQLSHRDSLTKLYNRRYFKQQLNREWFRLRRTDSCLSIILCDIDYFKLFNDTYGHQEGDLCLQQVADALSKTLKRSADLVARYGGEEFVVVMPDTDEAGAVGIAESLRTSVKALQIPHEGSLVNSTLTLSLGVATTIPNAEHTPKMLLKAADDALYLAKHRGRDTVAVYEHAITLSSESESDQDWAKRIRFALDNDLFQLYVQPIESLKGDCQQHFEVFLRLEDRAGQVFPPSYFFKIAEHNGLMSSIDTWVINKLIEELTKASDRLNWQNYKFSINLSKASLSDRHFLKFLLTKIAQHQLPPELFCFEITEAIAVDNIKDIQNFILALKALGCQFALDDFGKGMCSLTHLKNFPVDYLKIDGSFIVDLHQNKVSLVMVEAIRHLATGIGLKTVAEFVENQEILDTLHRLDIDYAQGYHLGRLQRLAEIV